MLTPFPGLFDFGLLTEPRPIINQIDGRVLGWETEIREDVASIVRGISRCYFPSTPDGAIVVPLPRSPLPD